MVLSLLCAMPVFGQELTEEQRQSEIKALYANKWESYEEFENALGQWALKYVAMPESEELHSGLEQLFMIRRVVPGERLREVYYGLTDEQKASAEGRLLRFWLDAERGKEGQKYFDFTATTNKGRRLGCLI